MCTKALTFAWILHFFRKARKTRFFTAIHLRDAKSSVERFQFLLLSWEWVVCMQWEIPMHWFRPVIRTYMYMYNVIDGKTNHLSSCLIRIPLTVLVIIKLTKMRLRCGSVAVAVNLLFVFFSSFFAMFKNVVHSRRLTRLQTMCNVLKFRKIL